MTEDKRPDKTGRTQQGMFPDTWIVGPAAAVLAKNDVDVLLADDALAEPDTASSEVGVSTVDDALAKPATATSITPEQELAELRAENERLVRRAVGYSYRRLQPMLDRVEHLNAGRETAEVVD